MDILFELTDWRTGDDDDVFWLVGALDDNEDDNDDDNEDGDDDGDRCWLVS